MKKLIALGLIGLVLAGCGEHDVAIETRKTIVVAPDDASYAMCPPYMDIPTVTDTDSGKEGVLILYGAYSACRQTVSDIKAQIARLKAIAERDNKN